MILKPKVRSRLVSDITKQENYVKDAKKQACLTNFWHFQKQVMRYPDLYEPLHKKLCMFTQENYRRKKLLILLFLCATSFAAIAPVTSFNTGQVSPLLELRADFEKYKSSCRTLENFMVTAQGPVM